MSSLMSTAQRASVSMLCVVLLGYLVPSWSGIVPAVGYEGGTAIFARVSCFMLPPVAVQIGITYVIEWEKQEKSVDFGTMFDTPLDVIVAPDKPSTS